MTRSHWPASTALMVSFSRTVSSNFSKNMRSIFMPSAVICSTRRDARNVATEVFAGFDGDGAGATRLRRRLPGLGSLSTSS